MATQERPVPREYTENGEMRIQAAPGAVFIRIGRSSAEMTPGAALTVIKQLQEAVRESLAREDGRQLLRSIPICA